MAVNRIADTGAEPVTLADFKEHARVTGTDQDSKITRALVSARMECEEMLCRSIVLQTRQKTMDAFPLAIELPFPKIISVTSVQYLDYATGVLTTLSPSLYTLDDKSEPGLLVAAYGYAWPIPREDINAVTVTYTAGYASAAAVPAPIKEWILIRATEAYENAREMSIIGATIMQNQFVAKSIESFRVY